jgi:ABC-2 type transport system permease protein
MGHAVRSIFWRAIAFAVVLEAMLIPAVLYWPDFVKNFSSLREMIPIPVLREAADSIAAGGVFAYVAGQHFFKGCNTLGTAAAVLMAVGAVAGEAHRGTLEIWLARPLSRKRILSERWLQGALATALPVFATSLTVPFWLHQVGSDLPYKPLLLGALHQNLLLLVIYGIAFFLSTLARSPLGIAFVMLFFTILEFAIYMVERVTHWSLFRLTDIERFMWINKNGALELRIVLPLCAVIVASYIASLIAFERRAP